MPMMAACRVARFTRWRTESPGDRAGPRILAGHFAAEERRRSERRGVGSCARGRGPEAAAGMMIVAMGWLAQQKSHGG
jgi:hypothetical protein